MTHPERLQWIAEQEERDLTRAWRRGSKKKVPRFPMLRKVCRICDGVGLIYPGGTSCPVCPTLVPKSEVLSSPKGRGWVPVDSLDATLPCAYEWRFENLGKEILAYCRLTPYLMDHSGHGPTHQGAAVSALYKALGGPVGEE
mgnify:FL=1